MAKRTNDPTNKPEDVYRIAEGLREFLGEFPELKNRDKFEALKIVTKNFKDSLT